MDSLVNVSGFSLLSAALTDCFSLQPPALTFAVFSHRYDLSEDGSSSQPLRSLEDPHSHSENASLL